MSPPPPRCRRYNFSKSRNFTDVLCLGYKLAPHHTNVCTFPQFWGAVFARLRRIPSKFDNFTNFKAFPLVSTDFPRLVHIKSFSNKTREKRPIRRVVIRSRLFIQVVIWKFVSVVVWSALLTFFSPLWLGSRLFSRSTSSLKVVGDSVIAATCDTSDGAPGTRVFLPCGEPSHERQKTRASHYLSLTETVKRAIKVSRTQGVPKQASNFFLRATAFFNSLCNNCCSTNWKDVSRQD